jgi:hypothetical protein
MNSLATDPCGARLRICWKRIRYSDDRVMQPHGGDRDFRNWREATRTTANRSAARPKWLGEPQLYSRRGADRGQARRTDANLTTELIRIAQKLADLEKLGRLQQTRAQVRKALPEAVYSGSPITVKGTVYTINLVNLTGDISVIC